VGGAGHAPLFGLIEQVLLHVLVAELGGWDLGPPEEATNVSQVDLPGPGRVAGQDHLSTEGLQGFLADELEAIRALAGWREGPRGGVRRGRVRRRRIRRREVRWRRVRRRRAWGRAIAGRGLGPRPARLGEGTTEGPLESGISRQPPRPLAGIPPASGDQADPPYRRLVVFEPNQQRPVLVSRHLQVLGLGRVRRLGRVRSVRWSGCVRRVRGSALHGLATSTT
jgi:hypothetical protein